MLLPGVFRLSLTQMAESQTLGDGTDAQESRSLPLVVSAQPNTVFTNFNQKHRPWEAAIEGRMACWRPS